MRLASLVAVARRSSLSLSRCCCFLVAGGLDKAGVVEEDDDDEMLRLAESDEGREIKSAAASLSNFETKLEEAIVRRNFKRVASHEKVRVCE